MRNMPKIIMTKGLCGSGKTTWAIEQVKNGKGKVKMVGKDELRKMLDAGNWSGSNEHFVLHVRDFIVSEALGMNCDIIVSDTGFAPAHEERLKQIAKEHNATFEINDSFCSVPIEECIKRDLKRPDSVGEKVIRDMARQYLEPKVEVPKFDGSLPMVALFDIDGTLALSPHRSPYDFSRVSEDQKNVPIVLLAERIVKHSCRVIFVSGREEICRKETEEWLKKNINLDGQEVELHMRPEGDRRKDVIIKKEIYEREIKGKYNVWLVVDDRNQTVEGWRALGLTCLQCDEGNF